MARGPRVAAAAVALAATATLGRAAPPVPSETKVTLLGTQLGGHQSASAVLTPAVGAAVGPVVGLDGPEEGPGTDVASTVVPALGPRAALSSSLPWIAAIDVAGAAATVVGAAVLAGSGRPRRRRRWEVAPRAVERREASRVVQRAFMLPSPMTLEEALQRATTTTRLDLGGSIIGAAGGVRLAEVLERNPPLRSLELSWSGIGPVGIARLSEALIQNTGLTRLGLNFNLLGDYGANQIAEMLERNSSLTSLDLRHNSITPEGTARLAQALEHNSGLARLDLSENRIGNDGAASLAAAIGRRRPLKRLTLCDTHLGPFGAASLAKALAQDPPLEVLDLRTNDIDDEGAMHLAQFVSAGFNDEPMRLWSATTPSKCSTSEPTTSANSGPPALPRP